MASEACCRIPPVSAEHREIPHRDRRPQRGLIFLYDAFGFAPQTLQGADRLAQLLGDDAVVVLPDLLEGTHPELGWLPADTPEKRARVKGWFDSVGDYRQSKPKLLRARGAAGAMFPSVASWGVFGLCWGGKPAVLASGADNEGEGRRFNVSGTAHPGALDKADAEALTVPHIVLASKDEPADVVAQYKEILEGQSGKTGVVEIYSAMNHGWMGIRAKLHVEDDRKEYERGYKQVADFFNKHL
ncbi:uncharacterized protein PG986_000711 [Apiospora aurea]|uniref:Dienelactone hydrolase domain-containing protein n=1 Tax=Apiospora aurea TaxID=335848 RepID=A0ABR1QV14_9PEZI